MHALRVHVMHFVGIWCVFYGISRIHDVNPVCAVTDRDWPLQAGTSSGESRTVEATYFMARRALENLRNLSSLEAQFET